MRCKHVKNYGEYSVFTQELREFTDAYLSRRLDPACLQGLYAIADRIDEKLYGDNYQHPDPTDTSDWAAQQYLKTMRKLVGECKHLRDKFVAHAKTLGETEEALKRAHEENEKLKRDLNRSKKQLDICYDLLKDAAEDFTKVKAGRDFMLAAMAVGMLEFNWDEPKKDDEVKEKADSEKGPKKEGFYVSYDNGVVWNNVDPSKGQSVCGAITSIPEAPYYSFQPVDANCKSIRRGDIMKLVTDVYLEVESYRFDRDLRRWIVKGLDSRLEFYADKLHHANEDEILDYKTKQIYRKFRKRDISIDEAAKQLIQLSNKKSENNLKCPNLKEEYEKWRKEVMNNDDSV